MSFKKKLGAKPMEKSNIVKSSETNTIIMSPNNKKSSCSNNNNNNVKRAKRHGLVSFRELPEYMKDNEFILDYYRVNWPLKEAFFSLLRWHNETLNVWTYVTIYIYIYIYI